MTAVALGLILAAAGCHAAWNLVAKRVSGGPAFAALFTALSAAIYAPIGIAAFAISAPRMTGEAWLFVAGNGVLHVGYLLALLRGYRGGDLSVVYPVARGTGPLLASLGAVVILGERPSPVAFTGIGLIAVGVFSLARGEAGARPSAEAVLWGTLTGAVIAVYTVWDKHAVAVLGLTPLFYNWAGDAARAALLLPLAARTPGALGAAWRHHRRPALVIAVLAPFAYVLVLTALVTTPVSYVAPAREVSILIGAVLGARLLGEAEMRRRIPAAVAIVTGVLALALG